MSQTKKREAILNLEKLLDKPVSVRFSGGREVTGILRGFDSMVNLVLDECVEYVRDPEDPSNRKTITVQGKTVDVTRKLGIVVCRGTAVSYICPAEGTQEIPNPFVDQDEGDE